VTDEARKPVAERRAEAAHAQLLAQQQAEDDMRWLMGDERGRRLVWGWLADGGLFRTPWTGEQHSTDFNCGKHSAAIKLHAQVMQHAPEQFIRMLVEAQAPAK
jgi:hypothetical protein